MQNGIVYPSSLHVSELESRESRPEPRVSFHPVTDFMGWDKAPELMLNLIKRHSSEHILEIGCGANPTLPSQTVSDLQIKYTANDISAEELDKAEVVFDRWVCDLSRPTVPTAMRNRFDLVFSRMVNEHVSDGRAYHANIHAVLKPGGIAAHSFSTLYALPFVANRLVPESISQKLLNLLRPRDSHKLGKFPAHYDWSRGPSSKMIQRFEGLGYEVLDYKGYFGHHYYSRVPLLSRLEDLKNDLLLSAPIPLLCSYATVIARKR